jgi:hypothetical protein
MMTVRNMKPLTIGGREEKVDFPRPHLIEPLNGETVKEIGINRVPNPWLTRARLRIHGLETHQPHYPGHRLAFKNFCPMNGVHIWVNFKTHMIPRILPPQKFKVPRSIIVRSFNAFQKALDKSLIALN